MTTELQLGKTNASGLLLPARLASSLALLAKLPGARPAPHGIVRGQELRLGVTLSPEDPAAAAFLLEFGGQGLRVRGAAHGPSAALLAWAFHALAEASKCTLHDVEDDVELTPEPEAWRERANAYLEIYEAEVADHRRRRVDDARAFLDWLRREEHLALEDRGDAVRELAESVSMQDASSLYEALLESDAVGDVFVSESELAGLLARFVARANPGR